MKNLAAAGIKKITCGVSIGDLLLQVAKTYQPNNSNTKLNEYQLKKTVLRTNLCFYRAAV
jgi:hypothetical protein